MTGTPERDKHHPFWPRTDYRDHHLLYQLRTRPGLIARMGRVAHNALHRELDPPPLVTPDLAFDIIEYLDETEPSNEIEAVRFYLEVEADNPMRPLAEQDYLQNIAEHLTRQLVFLEVGRYECLE